MKPRPMPHSLPLVAPQTVAVSTEIVRVDTSASFEVVKIEEHVSGVMPPVLHHQMIQILAASTEIVRATISASSEAVKHEEHVLGVMPSALHQMIPKLAVGTTTVLTLTPSVVMMQDIV